MYISYYSWLWFWPPSPSIIYFMTKLEYSRNEFIKFNLRQSFRVTPILRSEDLTLNINLIKTVTRIIWLVKRVVIFRRFRKNTIWKCISFRYTDPLRTIIENSIITKRKLNDCKRNESTNLYKWFWWIHYCQVVSYLNNLIKANLNPSLK